MNRFLRLEPRRSMKPAPARGLFQLVQQSKFVCYVPGDAQLAVLDDGRLVMIAPAMPPSWVTADGLVPIEFGSAS